jgi:hypothetical protein
LPRQVERAAQCPLVATCLEQHVESTLVGRTPSQRAGVFHDVDYFFDARLQRAVERQRSFPGISSLSTRRPRSKLADTKNWLEFDCAKTGIR